MKLPINNHMHIHPDGSISIDGNELLVEKGSMVIDGYGDPDVPTKVMLTLVPSTITIETGEEEEVPESPIATAYVKIEPDFHFSKEDVVNALKDAGISFSFRVVE